VCCAQQQNKTLTPPTSKHHRQTNDRKQGFDKAVTGLAVGESRKVRVAPDEAYGERQDDAVITVPAGEAGRGGVLFL
jgi:FKBP-type peptidyl-prolyl cis-trans isomerase